MSEKCKHDADQISGRWKYVGDKLVSASGYCMLCGLKHRFCQEANLLVPFDKVKKPLPKEKCQECER